MPTKTTPKEWKLVFDADAISRAVTRISYEILERDRAISQQNIVSDASFGNVDTLAIVGIRTYGEVLGRRICDKISEIEKREIPFGVLDITLYRDDLSHNKSQPTLKGTDLPFQVTGSRIVLIDDVLYTGRTIRSALDAIVDFGRPSRVELGVLIDRGHRELPIRADYVGKNIPSEKKDFIRVRMSEHGYDDGVYMVVAADAATSSSTEKSSTEKTQ